MKSPTPPIDLANATAIDTPTTITGLQVVLYQNGRIILAPLDSAQVGVSLSGHTHTLADVTDVAFLIGIRGLVPSQDADADHDVNFTAGVAQDDSNAVLITLSSEITKRSDATFAAGDDAGGMVSGESLPTSGTVHWWLIAKADGTTDICCNNHASSGLSPTLPTDYVYKRRIFSVTTDSSANITDFSAVELAGGGLDVRFNVPKTIINTTLGTTTTNYTTSVPLGVKFLANLSFLGFNGSAWRILAQSPDDTSTTPTASPPLFNIGAAAGQSGSYSEAIRTNTSGQIKATASVAGTTIQATGLGWTDERTL